MGFIFAFHVLPVIVFFSSLVSHSITWVLWAGLSALSAAHSSVYLERVGGIDVGHCKYFVGQTEAPLIVKPYIADMTRSELFAIMVGGMSTVAGSVLAGYVLLGVEIQYLLAASFMAAPGGFLMAKLLLPEAENSERRGRVHAGIRKSRQCHNAAASGASSGMSLALNAGAMVLAFVGLIALVNTLLSSLGAMIGLADLSRSFTGYAFQPLAFIVGIPWEETRLAGSLIGQKLVFNEFVAFVSFTDQVTLLSDRSQAIVTFALCGFANFSSIGIVLGGIGMMAPNRRKDIAELGFAPFSPASWRI